VNDDVDAALAIDDLADVLAALAAGDGIEVNGTAGRVRRAHGGHD
jgi:hypothetical protein